VTTTSQHRWTHETASPVCCELAHGFVNRYPDRLTHVAIPTAGLALDEANY